MLQPPPRLPYAAAQLAFYLYTCMRPLAVAAASAPSSGCTALRDAMAVWCSELSWQRSAPVPASITSTNRFMLPAGVGRINTDLSY